MSTLCLRSRWLPSNGLIAELFLLCDRHGVREIGGMDIPMNNKE